MDAGTPPPDRPAGLDAVVGLLDRLVGFDTVSARSNLGLIHWVGDYLRGHGVEPVILPDPTGTKGNLFATIGPAGPGGVVLSGHTDVVPADGRDWSSDPFTLTEREGRLVARGAADMKGFLACALALVPGLAARRPARPVHLAFSYDEEVGCLGAPALIDHIRRHLPPPALVVVGEPTSMRPVNAHKGMVCVDTEVTGREGHASAPQHGANAITYAARVAGFLADLDAERRGRAPDPRFEPPYGTLNVGTIAGGAARNVIPRSCTLSWEFRPLPGEDVEDVVGRVDRFVAADLAPRLKAEAPEGEIVNRRVVMLPALEPDPDGAAEALARQLSGANRAATVAFATEAGLFRQAGFPTVVIGPGDIAVAHRPDEYITRDQLASAMQFLERLAGWCEKGW